MRLIEQLARLQISYNLRNLPKQITAEDGTLVNYTYFADGTKFKAVDATGNGFVYTGSLRWSVQNGVFTPESVAITGGRAVYSSNGWAANYYITDHLGSVRAVTDAEGEVLGTFDYMPYGSEISSRSSTTTDYRFTGKERQSMVNNSIYDSFARFQNTYGRFMSIDPKAESFYHISPYTYCAGDPVNLVDPDGRIFTEALEAKVNILEVEIRNRITNYEEIIKELKPRSHEARKYKRYIADLEQALDEYQVLRDSEQIYGIVLDSPYKKSIEKKYPLYDIYGMTAYELGTNIFNIHILIKENLQHTLIHELKHAYQFEIGASSFTTDGFYLGDYGDYKDEKEAFARQASFSGNDNSVVPDFYKKSTRKKKKGRIKYPYSGTDIVHPKFRAN